MRSKVSSRFYMTRNVAVLTVVPNGHIVVTIMGNSTYNISQIYEFIDSAAHSRKYPANTASSLKTALRLFEGELTDEEKDSIELVQKNLNTIYRAVYEKNKTKYTANSLDVYRKRVSKVIKDYLAYGIDPSKMHAWSPNIRKRAERQKQKSNSTKSEVDTYDKGQKEDTAEIGSVKIEWPLSKNRKAIILIPDDLTHGEAKILKNLIGMRVGDHDEA